LSRITLDIGDWQDIVDALGCWLTEGAGDPDDPGFEERIENLRDQIKLHIKLLRKGE